MNIKNRFNINNSIIVISVILSIITSTAFCTDFCEGEKVIFTLRWAVFFVFFTVFYYFSINKCPKFDLSIAIFSSVTSVLWILCLSYIMYGGFREITTDGQNRIKTVTYLIGMGLFIYFFLSILKYFLEIDCDKNSKPNGLFSFKFVFAFLLIAWLPYLIICYPGEVTFDAYEQIYEGLGMKELYGHHPVLSSLYFSKLIEVSYNVFGTGSYGLYLIILVQYFSYAAVISYGTSMLVKEYDAPIWIGILSVVLPLIDPFYMSYVFCVVKDTMFTAGMMLMCIELILFVLDSEKFFDGYKHIILLSLASITIAVFRHNGKYILAAIAFFVIIYIVVKSEFKEKIKKILYFIVPIIISTAIVILFPIINNIPKGETVEALCMPIQQLARAAKYHPEYFTDEDIELINECIDFNVLADSYYPLCVDKTKGIINDNNPSQEAIMSMLKVWIKIVVKHPDIPILTTLSEFNLVIYPFGENIINDLKRSYDWMNIGEKYNITYPESLDSFKLMRDEWFVNIYRIPAIRTISNIGFCNLVIAGLFLFAAKKKIFFKFFITTLPALLTDVFIILGPCIFYNHRYGFPIIFTVPFLLGAYSVLSKK